MAAAGCGGAHSQTGTTNTADHASAKPRCDNKGAAAALVRLRRDVGAIRRAANLPTKDTLKGNPAINRATDRFLLDLGRARIDLLAKNRLIDRAAAALVGSCQQCFQALEAERPIPAVAHGGRCGQA